MGVLEISHNYASLGVCLTYHASVTGDYLALMSILAVASAPLNQTRPKLTRDFCACPFSHEVCTQHTARQDIHRDARSIGLQQDGIFSISAWQQLQSFSKASIIGWSRLLIFHRPDTSRKLLLFGSLWAQDHCLNHFFWSSNIYSSSNIILINCSSPGHQCHVMFCPNHDLMSCDRHRKIILNKSKLMWRSVKAL